MRGLKSIYFFALAIGSFLLAGALWILVEPRAGTLDLSLAMAHEIAAARQESARFDQQPNRNEPFSFYHYRYQNFRLRAWSTNTFVPEMAWLPGNRLAHVQIPRGDFLAIQEAHGTDMKVTLIPLVERYRITNQYLETSYNPRLFPQGNATIYDLDAPKGEPVVVEGETLFRVEREQGDSYGIYSLIATLTGLFFLFLSAGLFIRGLQGKWRLEMGFFLLLLLLIAVRWAMVATGFPEAWLHSVIFDPSTFASSAFNASLGNLFFNTLSVLILCVYLFRHFHLSQAYKWILRQRQRHYHIVNVVFMVFTFFGILFPFLYFETLFHNSTIDFDWTRSLAFDRIRVMAYLSIAVSILCSFLFTHLTISVALQDGRIRPGRRLLHLILATLVFLFYAWFLGRQYAITIASTWVLVVVLLFTGWHKHLGRISYLTFVYLLMVAFVHAGQGAFSVKRFMEEREGEAMQRFATTFLVGRDVLGEYLLSEAAQGIAEDPFIQARLGNPFFGTGSVRQKVRLVYLSSYFDRYETQVHLFTAAGSPLDAQPPEKMEEYLARYRAQPDSARTNGIYFIDSSAGDLRRGYVMITSVHRAARLVGFVAVQLVIKKWVTRSVYPQLLVDNRFVSDFRPSDYSFAVFQRDSLESSSGSFSYDRIHPAQVQAWQQGGLRHVVVAGENDRKVIVTTQAYKPVRVAANFAFWMLAGVALVLLWLFLVSMLNYRHSWKLNYAARIQLYVYAAFIIPLMAVTATTLTWTSSSATEQLNGEYREKVQVLAEQVAPALVQFRNGIIELTDFENYFNEIVKLTGVDASLYGSSGRLLATNQPLLFDNQILSRWINPRALSRIQNETGFILDERLGKLTYNNAYTLIRSPQTGERLGVLSIPFFDSASSLERERINILSNILIVFVVIMLLFTFLSFAATRWLTFPLRMITRTLSRTSLKDENRLIEWKANDEIGLMAEEYNKMVLNLEKSKIELARSQKESAWREMAQQVAHEIKNPLTPMKLILQQLDMSLKHEAWDRERTRKSLNTLLEQVEILNDIASSFSSFAKMPAPTLHRLDLEELLQRVVRLYQHQGGVSFVGTGKPLYVQGDDPLLSRIFSNLILNALQSGEEGSRVSVRVSLRVEGHYVVVQVADDGRGIDEAMKDKVFMPHFTTKKSGSGLGLAIAKQGVEQSGGTIAFETSRGVGTTFTVRFPLAS
ncbi:MAG: ATP-binding protein [Bacteroidota bacterium]